MRTGSVFTIQDQRFICNNVNDCVYSYRQRASPSRSDASFSARTQSAFSKTYQHRRRRRRRRRKKKKKKKKKKCAKEGNSIGKQHNE